ncbi:large ribosomal subunit protein bL21m [Lethenteron reissneri]|uniref:large ribosomal subunit protein bL21m n=1 Tax=Lethenteron reissneri TaxID=7753 RepID=UPI002AB7AB81|nr:large ribosomal subunit protein bL21m [Lethenteron reissneri]
MSTPGVRLVSSVLRPLCSRGRQLLAPLQAPQQQRVIANVSVSRHQCSKSSQKTITLPIKEAVTSLSKPPWKKVTLPDPEEEKKYHQVVVQTVNDQIAGGDYGRLFAVVHFSGKQFKVTAEDLILIEHEFQAECGDRIRMEKVMLVGAENFTLLGRPLLDRDLVRVEATVIEKTHSVEKIRMFFRRRKRWQRKYVRTTPQTVLRINSIDITPTLA